MAYTYSSKFKRASKCSLALKSLAWSIPHLPNYIIFWTMTTCKLPVCTVPTPRLCPKSARRIQADPDWNHCRDYSCSLTVYVHTTECQFFHVQNQLWATTMSLGFALTHWMSDHRYIWSFFFLFALLVFEKSPKDENIQLIHIGVFWQHAWCTKTITKRNRVIISALFLFK